MKTSNQYVVGLFIFFISFYSNTLTRYPTITSWTDALKTLPEDPDLLLTDPDYTTAIEDYEQKVLPLDELFLTINQATALMFQRYTRDPAEWLDQNMIKDYATLFQPFVQKLILPRDTKVAFWGDIHGSIHSLLRTLHGLIYLDYLDNNFKIIKENFYMVFLGDYSDRGKYGVEVLYTIARLKIANPEHVIILRGNHEDEGLNARTSSPGLIPEFLGKYPAKTVDTMIFIFNFYNALPAALYLGTKAPGGIEFVQCCHGGMELGYSPSSFINAPETVHFEKIDMLYPLAPKSEKYRLLEPFKPTAPAQLGFLWNDFSLKVDDVFEFNDERGGGWKIGKAGFDTLLRGYNRNKNKVMACIRAHQHSREILKHQDSPDGAGVFSMWDKANQVLTLLSAPDAYGLEFNYDSFVIVTLRQHYQNWIIQHLVERIAR